MSYHEIDESLAHVYLEDSFVLGIVITPGLVRFSVEFVLLPDHELYAAPKTGRSYHYHQGELAFQSVKSVVWSDQGVPPSVDPVDGSKDYGNIDSFFAENSTYFLEGDWGNMQIMSPERPKVVFQSPEGNAAVTT